MTNSTFEQICDDFLVLEDRDDRWQYLIELGRRLEPMPEALRNAETKVPGCVSEVYVYPTVNSDGTLHFLAASNSDLTAGTMAIAVSLVQDRSPAEILQTDVFEKMAPLGLKTFLTPQRAAGIPNMIGKIRETAARLA